MDSRGGLPRQQAPREGIGEVNRVGWCGKRSFHCSANVYQAPTVTPRA